MSGLAIFVFVALLTLTGCEEETPVGNAAISFELTNFTYAFRNGRHTYFHQRVFTETGGLGVKIVRGKVCVRDGAECSDALVSYRIEASQSLVQKNHYVATPQAKDRITMHYWAEDDAGNKFEFGKVLLTDGETIVVE